MWNLSSLSWDRTRTPCSGSCKCRLLTTEQLGKSVVFFMEFISWQIFVHLLSVPPWSQRCVCLHCWVPGTCHNPVCTQQVLCKPNRTLRFCPQWQFPAPEVFTWQTNEVIAWHPFPPVWALLGQPLLCLQSPQHGPRASQAHKRCW